MRYIFIRSQLIFVSVVLLVTFGLTMSLSMRFNKRWDFTKEKIYSLSESTTKLLKELGNDEIEVIAFYPHDDPARAHFETFLKECILHHPSFKYNFYDPDRVPSMAKQHGVRDHYTVLVRHGNTEERIIRPTEESFTNALLRLANPRKIELCFVSGHGEASLSRDDRTGYRNFRELLEQNNYTVHEIILSIDKVPSLCHVVVVPGPHRDLEKTEFQMIKRAFENDRGILFLIDPMDPGTGSSFRAFAREFGVVMGEDVIVDKMSRMVGGDFLVPLVSQYVKTHPITEGFNQPTFFPVCRSIQPAIDDVPGLEVVPLAMSGSGSWAEKNLQGLEKGEAAFEPESDLAGPISIAVAVEKKDEIRKQAPAAFVSPKGRMVMIGDSDFLTNTYLELSGNKDLALNTIQWLAKDDRFISVRPRTPEFKPLLLSSAQRTIVFVTNVILIPLIVLIVGICYLVIRRREP